MEFKLKSPYNPTGDQPDAIAALTKGVREGLRFQTLLGATGTGKSVVADTMIYVRDKNGKIEHRRIGQMIDETIKMDAKAVRQAGDSDILDLAEAGLEAWSFDPATGQSQWKSISAFTRHHSPDRLFRVRTACGRSVVATDDHNFYVMRDGALQLLKTEDIRKGDRIPVPRGVAGPSDGLAYVDITDVILQSKRSYYVPLPERAREREFCLAGLSRDKRFRVREYGERIRFNAVVPVLYGSARHELSVGPYSGGKVMLRQPVTDRFLRFLGYYVAEGHAEHNYFTLSTGDEIIAEELRAEAEERGFSFRHRPGTYDYQCNSALWTDVLRHWCGTHSNSKRLPPFWAQLADEQLGHLLRAYFSGDGGVEREIVSTTTVSEMLASDLLYALLRFGIVARMKRRSIATSASNPKGVAWRITISGKEFLSVFQQHIGFVLPRKTEKLGAIISLVANTNVDVIPFSGDEIRAARTALGLLQRDVADAAGIDRAHVGMIETGQRSPSIAVAMRIISAFEIADERHILAPLIKRWRAMLGLFWSPVAEVADVPGEKYVYDFSVVGNETFLAGNGGMFVHNTFTMANVIANIGKPTLVIAHNKTLAAQLCNEFREFFPENAVDYFVSYYDYYQPEAYMPSSDTYIEKESMINEEIDRLRHAATQGLLTRKDVIIVASVSCIYGLGAPEAYEKIHLKLRKGQTVGRADILRHLVQMQFERTTADLKRGSFRSRGDVIEIMPVGEEVIVRIELEREKIALILLIDPVSRKERARKDEVWVFPAKHFITPKEDRERAIGDVRVELKERLEYFNANGKLLEAERLERRTNFDMAMLREVGYCHGIENYSQPLSGRPPGSPPDTLLAYFPKDFLCLIDESHVTVPQVQGMFNGDQARKKTLIEYGFRLPSALDNRPLQFDEFLERAPQLVFVSATPGPFERAQSAQIVEQVIRPTGLVDPKITVLPVSPAGTVLGTVPLADSGTVPNTVPAPAGYKGQIDDLIARIDGRIAKNERTLVTTLTKKMAEDLTDYLVGKKTKVQYLHSDVDTIERVKILTEFRRGTYDVLVGVNLLREGLDLPEVTLVAILDADKEGFLRSETALIQTIGRAARNVNGEVVLYADEITGSMRRAIDETDRRRRKQVAYNEKHGITPTTIQKAIKDIMEDIIKGQERTAAILALEIAGETRTVDDLVKEKETQMREASKNLEFELAAILRDEIVALRKGQAKGARAEKKKNSPRKPGRGWSGHAS